MKILRVCWSQRQWTWNFKKSKLFGINSEFKKKALWMYTEHVSKNTPTEEVPRNTDRLTY